MTLTRFLRPAWLAWLGLFLATGVWAQSQATGAITTANNCVPIEVKQAATVGIQVTGTWSGTLQPEVAIQGQAAANVQVTPSTSTTAQNTITANGVYTAAVAGASTFLLCGNTVSSGTANVYLNASSATRQSASGSGSGTVSPNNGVANAIATYAAAGGSTTVAPALNTACIPGATSGSVCLSAPPVAGTANNPSLYTNSFSWATGLGAINHILGPSDAQLRISSGASQTILLFASSTLNLAAGGGSATWGLRTTGELATLVDNSSAMGVPGLAPALVLSYLSATPLTATAALTAGQVVKLDTANNSAVVVAATTDTGGGIVVGVVSNSPGAAGVASVVTSGNILTPLLGTGTCTKGQFVIVDTTTAGRVQCTSTYTAGTVIGKVTVAQAAVGSAVGVMVGLR